MSDPAVSLPVPEYEVLPVNANTQCFHSLSASKPSFVTLVGSPYGSPTIQILTTDVADTGVYSIDVTYSDEFSGIQKTDTFVLIISCVRAIAPTAPLADVTYWITDTAITRQPVFQLTPAGCPNELVFEVFSTGGTLLPGSITFNPTYGLETISVFEMDYALTAVYQIAVKVTDPKTGLANTSLGFQVTIKCTKTIDLISGSITGILYEIDLD